MPTERLSMRQIREILRQKWLLLRSHRAIAACVGVSAGVVGLAVSRAKAASLSWEVVATLDDVELERRLYPSVIAAVERIEPDCEWIHRERRRPGVTLELLRIRPTSCTLTSCRARTILLGYGKDVAERVGTSG